MSMSIVIVIMMVVINYVTNALAKFNNMFSVAVQCPPTKRLISQAVHYTTQLQKVVFI